MDTSSKGEGQAATPVAERVWVEFCSVLDTLPPATRVVFLLHILFDASCAEIERITGVRQDTCGRHLEEARRAMRERAHGAHHSSRDSDP